MENLVILWNRVLDSQHKLTQAQSYSDWAYSVRAFKAAETRASNRYSNAVKEYLGEGHTAQDRINLTRQVHSLAAA